MLKAFVEGMEALSGQPANLVPKPMMDADMQYTYADIGKAERLLGYEPKISVAEGIDLFWQWYHEAVLPA